MTHWLSDFLVHAAHSSQHKQFSLQPNQPQSRGTTGFCPESITFPDLRQWSPTTPPQTKLLIPVCWWYCTVGLQLKRMKCSKPFATGPPKIGNVVCQMENQTQSWEKQGDYLLQVHARQESRTQPKTIWRDTENLSSSEILRHYFWLKTHVPATLLECCNNKYYCLRLLANKKWGPSPTTLIQIYKQCVWPIFEHGSLRCVMARIQQPNRKFCFFGSCDFVRKGITAIFGMLTQLVTVQTMV